VTRLHADGRDSAERDGARTAAHHVLAVAEREDVVGFVVIRFVVVGQLIVRILGADGASEELSKQSEQSERGVARAAPRFASGAAALA
jgi:hypothetical protein